MFTGSTKLPPTKTPQPERLDEVYAALRRGLQWVNTSQQLFATLSPADHWTRCLQNGVVARSYLQVHQLELESLGQQIRENKRNGRLVRCSRCQTSHTTIDHSVPGRLQLFQAWARMLISHIVMLNVFNLVCLAGVSVWAGQGKFHSQRPCVVSRRRWNHRECKGNKDFLH